MAKVIEAEEICKKFVNGNIETDVLKNISFSVEEGEFVSIMGPSGSGKSTLLYILGSLDEPTTGSVKIGGSELTNLKDKQKSIVRRRNIGFVFQFYNLIPNLTVEENILLPVLLDNKNIKHYKKKLEEILKTVELYEKRKFKPKELSGGQQQRVAIARALINDPDIILADEPIGNLDSKSGIGIMTLLQELNRKNKTSIIQVTHSQESSLYGTRIINIKDGRIESDTEVKI